jgi:hypothetical protein
MDWSDLKKILFAWLLLPLTALDWGIAWGRLPARVVMKTGADGQPRGWASRGDAMMFDLKLLAGVLLFTTLIALLVLFQHPGRGSLGAWVVLICGGLVFLLVNGILWTSQMG